MEENKIQGLTDEQLKVLRYFDNPVKWIQENNKEVNCSLYSVSPLRLMCRSFGVDYDECRDFYGNIAKDLDDMGLLDARIMNTTMTPDGAKSKRTTSKARGILSSHQGKK